MQPYRPGESLLGLLDARAARGAAAIPSTAEQWTPLVDEALRHGVAPLLYRRVGAVGATAALPDATLARLESAYVHSALRQRSVRAELRQILLTLQRARTPVVLLKGAHLSDLVYPDPALRPMRDLDLLVSPTNLARVELALNSIGYDATPYPLADTDYSVHQHVHPMEKAGAIPIEVHRGLFPASAPFHVDVEGMLVRAQATCVAGVHALVLSPEDLVRDLCLHVSYVRRFDVPLLSLYDIAIAVRHYGDAIDWRGLTDVANADGTSRFVYCALLLVRATVGADIPDEANERLAHTYGDASIVRTARECILTPAVELPYAYREAHDVEGMTHRMRVLARGVWPPRERMRALYGLAPRSRAVYAYYVLRPIELLHRRGRTMAEIFMRSRRVRPTLDREEGRRAIDRWIDGTPSPAHGSTLQPAEARR